jgi:sRNA-binding protein
MKPAYFELLARACGDLNHIHRKQQRTQKRKEQKEKQRQLVLQQQREEKEREVAWEHQQAEENRRMALRESWAIQAAHREEERRQKQLVDDLSTAIVAKGAAIGMGLGLLKNR